MSILINETRYCPKCGEKLSIDIWPVKTLFICSNCKYFETLPTEEIHDENKTKKIRTETRT